MQPMAPWATSACGAAASHWFIEPHSSDSIWQKVIQRTLSTGTTRATASDTSGNMARGSVGNSRTSSLVMRNWLKLNPAGGATSATQVEMR